MQTCMCACVREDLRRYTTRYTCANLPYPHYSNCSRHYIARFVLGGFFPSPSFTEGDPLRVCISNSGLCFSSPLPNHSAACQICRAFFHFLPWELPLFQYIQMSGESEVLRVLRNKSEVDTFAFVYHQCIHQIIFIKWNFIKYYLGSYLDELQHAWCV